MPLDPDRIRAILTADHTYYGTRRAVHRQEPPSTMGSCDFAMAQLPPGARAMESRVLDIGCGSGDCLLEHAGASGTGRAGGSGGAFGSAIGIDVDPVHLRMAEEARLAGAIRNVEFLLLHFPRDIGRLEPESFDLVLSQRGMPATVAGFEAALRLLRPGGLLFCEEIGDEHLHEVVEIFGSGAVNAPSGRRVDQVREAMAQAGASIRLAADLYTQWIYPDVYEWLLWQCSLWTWLGVKLPEPDDPRIEAFARRTANAAGEIETTHHVVWVGGVRRLRDR
jgi:SAM-dependent methyltransferase